MFERPRAGERAVLVRLGLGAPADPEDVLEFEQLARSAGAIPVAAVGGRRDRPDPRFFVGSGKADEIRAIAVEHDAEAGAVRSSAVALAGTQSRETHRATRARSLGADPRHLRAARAQPRRQARGGTGAAQAHRLAPGARLDPPRTSARRRHRQSWSRRNAARNRPPPARQTRQDADRRASRRSSSNAKPAASSAPRFRFPRWRWWVTPTPASRPCSVR